MPVTENYELERAYGFYLQTMNDTAAARDARLNGDEPPEFHGR